MGEGWRIRQTTVGKLVSMLVRPFAGVGRVALDPLPGVLGRRTVGLVSLGREDFVRRLLDERRARITAPGRGLPAERAPHQTNEGRRGRGPETGSTGG